MTEFRRRLRYHQARWREAHGHPIGSQPILPRAGQSYRPVGNRVPLDYARDTGASFLTAGALAAARARTAVIERNQSFDHQRFWAELLWSPTLALNLFGDLASDPARADRAVHAWWPETPGNVIEIRFEHSPGWLDPAYLNSLQAFDAVFVLDLGKRGRGVLAIDVKYHEPTKPETPKPENLGRYREVAQRSGVFAAGAADALERRSDLAVMWLEHLLLLSMLQHPDAGRSWGRYAVVHPAGNSDLADACARYRTFLADDSTFSSLTLEQLLRSGVLPRKTASAVRERYLPR
jgi:hypothetical protein